MEIQSFFPTEQNLSCQVSVTLDFVYSDSSLVRAVKFHVLMTVVMLS